MKLISLLYLLITYCHKISGFMSTSAVRPLIPSIRRQSMLYNTNAEDNTSELKPVDYIISDMHKSGYSFRIVVIGNGAILEVTSKLGPTMKSSVSPKTGGRLITLASEDKSFEFHVKVDEVNNIVFAESVQPLEGGGEKILRICRFMNGEGGSICSLILGEYEDAAIEWFTGMKERYEKN